MVVWIIILFTIFFILFIYQKAKVKKAERKFPPTGKFVTVDGCKLHYIRAGEGQPVVFLHGGMLSSIDFKDVVKQAAKRGYDAIAFDRPGYGYSERLKKMTPMTQAEMIHKALKQIGINEPIILVGHSWSGTMVLSYALQFPNEVAGIVMLAAAMYKEGYPAENGDYISRVVTTPIIGSFILHTLLKSPLGKGMARVMVKSTFFPEAAPLWYEEAAFALGFRPRHFRANREDVLAFPGTSKELCRNYKNIKIPTVIVVGDKDPFGVIEQGRRLKEDLPNAIYKELSDIGHMIPNLHPGIVVDQVDFIARHTRNLITSTNMSL